VSQKGESAVQTRAWARKVSKDWEADVVKNMFLQQGMIGSGKFEKEDPTALTDTYRYRAELKAEKFIKFPGSGAFPIQPLFGAAGSIQNFFTYSMEPEDQADVACTSAALTEGYEIELPKTMKVLSVPEDLKISNDFAAYNATYRVEGNVLHVKRAIDDHTKGNVCSPKVMAQYKSFGDKVMDDLKSQVLYK
jgi:hypothetical protein